MVHLKFFGESKKATCIKRQNNAQAAHVPLCVEVSFEESSNQFCFSVHEPTLHNYRSELIVKTGKSCLTRADFWGLGLNNEMESTLIMFGKSIFVADLYVVATWRSGTSCDPLASLPNDASIRDAIVIPVWKPGHFLNLSQSLNPGNWTEKTGLQIQGFPGQPYGIDCGIFMLMVVDIICLVSFCTVYIYIYILFCTGKEAS
uniref:Si:dkey-13e3.1 n=1 Tax=Stegastes partitus TaxID=144197 RepID=A0A3B4ZUG1_9TELE